MRAGKGGDAVGGITKRQRKVFRQLMELARTREQASHLRELGAKFDQWREGSITGDDLDLAIHKYHQGPARDVYLRYGPTNGPEVVVGMAVGLGFLSKGDIPDDLWEEVALHAKALGYALNVG
jgi:hypothetical protein